MTIRVLSVAGLCVVLAGMLTDAQQAPAERQPPRFRSSVEVTSIDVGVVDNQGKAFLNLTPADFSVRVDGKARRVVSAEWVALATTEEKVHLGVFYEEDRPVFERTAHEFEAQINEFVLDDYLKRFA